MREEIRAWTPSISPSAPGCARAMRARSATSRWPGGWRSGWGSRRRGRRPEGERPVNVLNSTGICPGRACDSLGLQPQGRERWLMALPNLAIDLAEEIRSSIEGDDLSRAAKRLLDYTKQFSGQRDIVNSAI